MEFVIDQLDHLSWLNENNWERLKLWTKAHEEVHQVELLIEFLPGFGTITCITSLQHHAVQLPCDACEPGPVLRF